MSYHVTSNWLGEPTRLPLEPDPDSEYDRWRDDAAYDKYIDSKIDEYRETGVRPPLLPRRRNLMPHHFNKQTVQAACWCNACGKETPWRIVDGRRQYCLPCQDKKPPAVAKPQSNQMSFWTKAGK